jgi:metacaspase-1
MKILLVHGVGHCDANPDYYESWQDAIARHLSECGMAGEASFEGFHYDDLFDKHNHATPVYLAAIGELAAAAAWQKIADPLEHLFHPSRGFGDDVRWKAGMVAQLCVEDALRRDLRDQLNTVIAQEQPDVIAAHSLGTLVTYDFFRNDARGRTIASNATYITFGSQINNVFTHSRLFPGPLKVPNVRFWYHLYNRLDPVLTAAIDLRDTKFLQVLTPSPAGHDPIGGADQPGYLNHPNTMQLVWRALATPSGARDFVKSVRVIRKLRIKPRRRALLIGINEYPDPAHRLEGCVNDTFLISALLQERGFDPEDIRVVLDDRATADGIRERLSWLLDGADDGTERVLFYSGHGAQIPGYNPAERVDHVDECLVPWDFDWSKERAVMDDDFFALYKNLPFDARFFAIFDCCHAGGIHREGGPKIRGLTPPDDIRHRLMQWDARQEMWRLRKLEPLNEDFGGSPEQKRDYMGRNHATYRIGRGMRGRALPMSVYKKLRPDERGPYLPVIIEACQEGSLSYEYRDGATSYGAFTYSFAKDLRRRPRSSFVQAVARSAQTLTAMDYKQVPQIIGPASIVNRPIPGAAKRGRSAA